MNDGLRSRPAMLIDQKKARIRIYKSTLHGLGDPNFIQLLVNPKDLTVVIRPANQKDHLVHRVLWEKLISKKSYELYSRYFICRLQEICGGWAADQSYRLLGEFIPGENIVRFDLRNASPICSGDKP